MIYTDIGVYMETVTRFIKHVFTYLYVAYSLGITITSCHNLHNPLQFDGGGGAEFNSVQKDYT